MNKKPWLLEFVNSFENYEGLKVTRDGYSHVIDEKFSENIQERFTFDRGRASWFTWANYVLGEDVKIAMDKFRRDKS